MYKYNIRKNEFKTKCLDAGVAGTFLSKFTVKPKNITQPSLITKDSSLSAIDVAASLTIEIETDKESVVSCNISDDDVESVSTYRSQPIDEIESTGSVSKLRTRYMLTPEFCISMITECFSAFTRSA
ncbi:hypothetical protein A3Q56_08172, partial [Intoshia linei]